MEGRRSGPFFYEFLSFSISSSIYFLNPCDMSLEFSSSCSNASSTLSFTEYPQDLRIFLSAGGRVRSCRAALISSSTTVFAIFSFPFCADIRAVQKHFAVTTWLQCPFFSRSCPGTPVGGTGTRTVGQHVEFRTVISGVTSFNSPKYSFFLESTYFICNASLNELYDVLRPFLR